jgi:single-strand DNA-binding protein
MQKVLLIGYLGRDPEVRYSAQGTVIAQFSVASTERWRDKSDEPQEHTEWFAVKAFGRKAEVIGEYLHKGSRVYVEGRKRTESWDDKQPAASTTETSFTPTESSSSTPTGTARRTVTETNNTVICRKSRRSRIARSRSEGGLISHAEQREFPC